MTDKQREECKKQFEELNNGAGVKAHPIPYILFHNGYQAALNSESVKGLVEALHDIAHTGYQCKETKEIQNRNPIIIAREALEKFNGGSDE